MILNNNNLLYNFELMNENEKNEMEQLNHFEIINYILDGNEKKKIKVNIKELLCEKEINDERKNNIFHQNKIEELENIIRNITEKMEKQDEKIKHQDEQIKNINEQIKKQDEQIKHQDEQIKHQDEQIKKQDEQIKHQNEQIKNINEQIKQQIKKQDEQIKKQNELTKNKDETIESMKKKENKLSKELDAQNEEIKKSNLEINKYKDLKNRYIYKSFFEYFFMIYNINYNLKFYEKVNSLPNIPNQIILVSLFSKFNQIYNEQNQEAHYVPNEKEIKEAILNKKNEDDEKLINALMSQLKPENFIQKIIIYHNKLTQVTTNKNLINKTKEIENILNEMNNIMGIKYKTDAREKIEKIMKNIKFFSFNYKYLHKLLINNN